MDLRQRVEVDGGFFMAEGHLIIERCAALGLPFEVIHAGTALDGDGAVVTAGGRVLNLI